MTRQETRNTANQVIKNFLVKSDQTSNLMKNRRRSFHNFETRDAENELTDFPGQKQNMSSARSCDRMEGEETQNESPKSTNRHVFKGQFSLQQFKIQSPRNMLRRSKSDQGDGKIKRHAVMDSFVGVLKL